MGTVARVYTSVRGLTVAIKDVGRMREIVGILIKHGFGALVTRLHLTDTVGIKNVMDYRDGEDSLYSTPQRVRMAIEELGPTFIKLGQILSTRGDLLPPEFIHELEELQDHVPPMIWEDVAAQVRENLGAEVDEVFESFERTPLACASIAQVHRARYKAAECDVVVKIQRKDIAERIDSDLNILQFLARRAESLVPELELLDPVGIVREFDKAIRREIDFRHELQHIRRFQKNFAKFEGVYILRVFEKASTDRVLTMEFIDGIKVTLAPEKHGIDPYEVAPRMLKTLFKMVFQDGYFHGDLHPGNILIKADGTIAMIDFGLVGRLTESQRDNVMDVIIAMIREDYEGLSRTFFDVGIKVPGVRYDYAAFQQDVVEIMQKHIEGRTLNDIDVGAYFTDLVTGAIRHRIKMPPAYTMVFKALMTVEGIGKTLAPDLNLLEEARPFAKDMLSERYSPARLIKHSIDTTQAFTKFMRQFPHAATQLLQDAEAGNLNLNVTVSGLDQHRMESEASARAQTRATVAGGALVAGAIAMQAGEGPLLGLNIPAFILFTVAVVLALPVVGSLLRSR